MAAGSPLATLATRAPHVDMQLINKEPPCEDLSWFCKQRILIEADYVQRLQELARNVLSRADHHQPSMSSVAPLFSATESSAAARADLVQQLKKNLESPLTGFLKEHHELTEARNQQMENSRRLKDEHEDNVVQATRHRDDARARITELKAREGALPEEIDEAEDILKTTEEALEQCEQVLRDVSIKHQSDEASASKVLADLEARQAQLVKTSLTTFATAMAHTSEAELKTYQDMSTLSESPMSERNGYSSHDAVSSAIREVESMLSAPTTSQSTRSAQQSTYVSPVSTIPPLVEASRPASLPVLARPQLSDDARSGSSSPGRNSRQSNDSLKDTSNKYRPVPNPAFSASQSPSSSKSTKQNPPKTDTPNADPILATLKATTATTAVAREVVKEERRENEEKKQATNETSHPAPLQAVDSGCFSGNEEGETYVPIRPPPKEEKWTISSRREPEQRPVQAQNIREYSSPGLRTSYLGHPPSAGQSQVPLPSKEAKHILATVKAELQQSASPEFDAAPLSYTPEAHGFQYGDTMQANSIPPVQENDALHGAYPRSDTIMSSDFSAISTPLGRPTEKSTDKPVDKLGDKKKGSTPSGKSRLSLDIFKKSSTPVKMNKPLKLSDGTPLLHHVRALWSYDAQIGTEISFRANDTLGVIRKQFDGWWEAEITSDPQRKHRGLVPGNYMESIEV